MFSLKFLPLFFVTFSNIYCLKFIFQIGNTRDVELPVDQLKQFVLTALADAQISPKCVPLNTVPKFSEQSAIGVVIADIDDWDETECGVSPLCDYIGPLLKYTSCEGDVNMSSIGDYPGISQIDDSLNARGTSLSNDPLLKYQWGFEKMEVTRAVDISLEVVSTPASLESILVGVIDSGIRVDHPDLPVWVNPGEIAGNGVDDDGNGYVDDVNGFNFSDEGDPSDVSDLNGHGTHVAGIVAARSNNGIGVASPSNLVSGRLLSGEAKVYIITCKFLTSEGSGKLSSALACIQYLLINKVKISNNSWGCLGVECRSSALEQAILKAGSVYGHLFIAAAGNDGNDNDNTPAFPCSYVSSTVLCVCASNDSDGIASFSNTGISTVDICAPGTSIASTYIVPNDYVALSGTSMAAPYVASAAAMLQMVVPNGGRLRASQMRWLLTSYVQKSSAFTDKVSSGGVLNIGSSLEALRQHNFSPVPPKIATVTRPFVCVPDTSGDDECSLVSITHIGDGWWRVSRWSDQSYSSKETAEFSFLSPATIEFEKMSIETSNSNCVYDGLVLGTELFCSATLDDLGARKEVLFAETAYARGAWYSDDAENSKGFSFKYKFTGDPDSPVFTTPPQQSTETPTTKSPESVPAIFFTTSITLHSENKTIGISNPSKAVVYSRFNRDVLDNSKSPFFNILEECIDQKIPYSFVSEAWITGTSEPFVCKKPGSMCAFVGACNGDYCTSAWNARVSTSRRILGAVSSDGFSLSFVILYVLVGTDSIDSVDISNISNGSCKTKLATFMNDEFHGELSVDSFAIDQAPRKVDTVREIDWKPTVVPPNSSIVAGFLLVIIAMLI